MYAATTAASIRGPELGAVSGRTLSGRRKEPWALAAGLRRGLNPAFHTRERRGTSRCGIRLAGETPAGNHQPPPITAMMASQQWPAASRAPRSGLPARSGSESWFGSQGPRAPAERPYHRGEKDEEALDGDRCRGGTRAPVGSLCRPIKTRRPRPNQRKKRSPAPARWGQLPTECDARISARFGSQKIVTGSVHPS